ncbi:MAG: hypothetical protein KTU85_08840 [Acidimicrobiia bacterium]|nr:hypothetical protein [Acidimicrobiia bacterium]
MIPAFFSRGIVANQAAPHHVRVQKVKARLEIVGPLNSIDGNRRSRRDLTCALFIEQVDVDLISVPRPERPFRPALDRARPVNGDHRRVCHAHAGKPLQRLRPEMHRTLLV